MPKFRRQAGPAVPRPLTAALRVAALCAVAGLAAAGPVPVCFRLAPGESQVLPDSALTLTVIDVRDHICPPPIICLLPNRRLVRIGVGEGDAAPVLEINAWHEHMAQRSVQVAHGWLTVEPPTALCPLATIRPKRTSPPGPGVRHVLPYTEQSSAPVRLRWAPDLPAAAAPGQTGRRPP